MMNVLEEMVQVIEEYKSYRDVESVKAKDTIANIYLPNVMAGGEENEKNSDS